jgi:hypothetical protein
MVRFLKWSAVLTTLAAALLGGTSSARANLVVKLSEDGGAATTVINVADFTSGVISQTFGDFQITFLGASSDNAANLSDLLSEDLRVKNIGTTGTHTLTITMSQNNYTLPAGSPLFMSSSIGGTVNVATTGGLDTFQSYADKNNANAISGPSVTTTGAQSADLSVPGSWSSKPSDATALFARSGNYSVTTVNSIKLGQGGDIGFQSQTNLVPTPAPAGATLALSACPLLGLGLWFRRRGLKGSPAC